MEECFRCGTTKEETRLFDAIADEGIVKACRDCILRESLPTVKKPSLDQLKESDERLSVKEKLSMMAGIETKRDSQGNRKYVKTSLEKGKGEYDLNDIIERNLEKRKLSKKSLEKLPPEKELVENFHWVVMRARRFKKLTKGQLGSEIGESETAINMVESGELPEDFERLIKKLESYLRIRLFKNQQPRKNSEAEISFDPYTTKETTIEDLKKESNSEVTKKEENNESKESLEEDYDYPEQNKARRKKLWNLFRNKARNVQNNEKKDLEEDFNKERRKYDYDKPDEDFDDLYYEDLEDYNYQEYEHPKKDDQKQRRDLNQNNKDKKDKDKKDKDELSQKDIDDLIFRK